jgi:hypothetical protein
VLSLDRGFAGSPLRNLENEFPCIAFRQVAELRLSDAYQVSVGIDISDRFSPSIVVNEKLAYEQPFEVVAFEYFSACEQIQLLSRGSFFDPSRDPGQAREFLRSADCRALTRLESAGVVRGQEAISKIIEEFQFWRANTEYFGVTFADRVDGIRNTCGL